MPHDASSIFRSQVGYGELERLSAIETLKGLKGPDRVTLAELIRYLRSRGLWAQFAKITIADLRAAFGEAPPPPTAKRRKPKQRILEDELADAFAARAAAPAQEARAETDDGGGFATEDVARRVLPFLEANGEVTLDELFEYVRLDNAFAALERKPLRLHLGNLVRDGRLERIGSGRHAVYSAL
jgi:hypothetical protein